MFKGRMLPACGALLLAGVLSCVDAVELEASSNSTLGVSVQRAGVAEQVQVLDLRPGDLGSQPTALTVVNGAVLFAATDDAAGEELWRTDGTEAGTYRLKDLNPGTPGSVPRGFTLVNGTAFFRGTGLWKTDGTVAGTVQVHPSQPPLLTSPEQAPVAMNGQLFFASYDNSTGFAELWKSDGTQAGTVMVKAIGTSYSASPRWLTVVNGRLFFAMVDGGGEELWRSDGTAAGTVRVRDICPGACDSKPRNLVNVNGILYFTADDGANGEELWRSDGTAAGTSCVRDLLLGQYLGSQPEFLTNVNGTLFFILDQYISSGSELWKTDGTAAGTVKVTNIPAIIRPPFVTAVGSTLYFAGWGDSPYELWKSDGTEAGTVRVRGFSTSSTWPVLANFTHAGGTLHFVFNGADGSELWRSDGTEAGTVRITSFKPFPQDAIISSIVSHAGTLYFSANDGLHGNEPWKSDGTAAGTALVRNIQTHGVSSEPKRLTDAAGTLFLVANEGLNGDQLWKSDGTVEGTARVKLLTQQGFPDLLTAVGPTLYFRANEPGFGAELMRSDGTEAGTFRVKDLQPGTSSSNPGPFQSVGGVLYFPATDEATGRELWRSDGTAAGTFRVKDLRPGSASSSPTPSALAGAGGTFFFKADDGVSGEELWKSDGTEVGTVFVKDIRPGATGSFPLFHTTLNGVAYFTAHDGVTGYELWRSDGTAAGTVLLKDIFPGISSGSGTPVAMGGALYFPAYDGVSGYELWKSDGTTAGTVMLKDIRPGRPDSSPGPLTPMNGALYFTADDGSSGRELWKTDGTAAGTVLVKDIRPGSTGAAISSIAVLEGMLYFVADDGVSGAELWKTDGTAAGTVRVTDLLPGTGSVSPTSLTVSGGRLYFLGDDFVHGKELWVLTPPGKPDTVPPQVTCPAPVTAEATDASGARVSYPAARATDDVTAAPSVSYDFPSGGLFPLGDTTVTATATDEAGNSAACQFKVTVRDTTAPTLTCPEDVLQEAASASGATVSYPAANASDTVSSAQVTYSQASGTGFAMGESTVTVTATDAAGNPATCRFKVTVRDTTAPAFTCPSDRLVEATGPSGASVGFVLPSAVDAVTASPQVTASHAPGGTFPLGPTVVTLSARDDAGNGASCQFTVTVRDTTAPQLACPVDLGVEATSASGAVVEYALPSAVDAVTASPTVTTSQAPGSTFALGATPVTLTATDAAGNVASCRFTVTLKDTTAPRLTCPVDVTAEATGASGATVTYPAASASDAVSSVALAYSHASGTGFPLAETTVTVTATDAAGNAASCQFKVAVRDTTAPQVTCPVDAVAEATSGAGAVVEFPRAQASDAVSPAGLAYSHESGTLFALGTTQVTATATDAAGNSASCRFTVTVRDTTPPDVGCAPDLVVEAEDASGADVAYLLVQPRDHVTRSPIVSVSHGPGSRFPLGTTEVSLTATDEAGNAASCRFTVTVRDTTAPQVTCPADLVAEAQDAAGSPVAFTLVPARDAVTATPTVELSHASGSRFPFGTTEVFQTVADAAGNAASCRFTVTVKDTTAPRLTCPADVAVETLDAAGAAVTYASASASDGISPVTVDYSQPSGGLFAPGATPVSVTATDAAGNVAECAFQVSVRVRKPVSVSVFPSGCSSAADAGGPMGLVWSALVLLGWQVACRRSRPMR